MELAFATKQLRSLCENSTRAKADLGQHVAEKLMHRLADLDAATTIYDLVVHKPCKLNGDLKGHLSLELAKDIHLVFSANHNDVPTSKDGSINWKQVRRIKIANIGGVK